MELPEGLRSLATSLQEAAVLAPSSAAKAAQARTGGAGAPVENLRSRRERKLRHRAAGVDVQAEREFARYGPSVKPIQLSEQYAVERLSSTSAVNFESAREAVRELVEQPARTENVG